MPELPLSDDVLKSLNLNKTKTGDTVYGMARLEKIDGGVKVTGLADISPESDASFVDTYGSETEEETSNPESARKEGTEQTEEQEAMPKEKSEEDILGFKRQPKTPKQSPDMSAESFMY